MKKLSWKNIDEQCEKIVKQLKQSEFNPDIIVSVGRGGMIPSRIISDRLNIKTIYIIYISIYRGINQRNDKPVILPFNHNITGKNILVVDDIIQTGITINYVIDELLARKPKSVRTAILLCKDRVVRKPTFYAEKVKQEQWIGFPWEKLEFKGEDDGN